jgi:hypothetical protein
LACPQCGADEQTGWSEDAASSTIDLPDDNFDYDDFVKKEFGGESPIPKGLHWFWWLVGVLLILGALVGWFGFMAR